MGRQADGDAGYWERGGHTLDLSGMGRGGNNPNCLLLEWKQGQKGKKKREKKDTPAMAARHTVTALGQMIPPDSSHSLLQIGLFCAHL